MIRRIAFAVILLALSFGARADFNDGVVAHLKGDYTTAFQTMLPLAKTANHALAQYYLGIMYVNGQGTKQDLAEASKWFDAAAKQGVAQAQYRMAEMYSTGKGAPLDLERAYAWLSVGAHLGHAKSQDRLPAISKTLKPEELANAKKLGDDYIKEYGKPPAENQSQVTNPQQ